jgi:hypothetical protein
LQRFGWWRWLVVAAAVAVLASLPALVAAIPARAPGLSVDQLYAKVVASAGQGYQGFAVSAGIAGLPSFPQLADSISLLNGETHLRVWYAGPDRWRVDQIGVGTEVDVYQQPGVSTTWDFGRNQLSTVVGDQPLRLPRGADLVPPELARRVLALTAPARATATQATPGQVTPGQVTPGQATASQGTSGTAVLTALDARRVAGIDAAGLRITPLDAHTTVGHVDLWADPATGLPLQVEITGRGAAAPILVTRFLDLRIATPDDAALSPPPGGPSAGHTFTNGADVSRAFRSLRLGPLPDALAGSARTDDPATSVGLGVYGTGFTRFVVIPIPRQTGSDAFDRAKAAAGVLLALPGGDGMALQTQLLTVMVVRAPSARRTYLVVGFVDLATLLPAASDLSTFMGGAR